MTLNPTPYSLNSKPQLCSCWQDFVSVQPEKKRFIADAECAIEESGAYSLARLLACLLQPAGTMRSMLAATLDHISQKVVAKSFSKKSIPAQIRQLILFCY